MTDTFEDRVAATLAGFRNWCEQNGVTVNGAGAVAEQNAARLLGYSPRNLTKQNEHGKCEIPYRRMGRSRWYTLEDLARHYELGYLDDG